MPRDSDARTALDLVKRAAGTPLRECRHGTIYTLPNRRTILVASAMGGRALTNFRAALRRALRKARP